MQETRPEDLSSAEAQRRDLLRQEFFTGERKSIKQAMDERLGELTNERLVRRVRVGRNDPCPCNSGRKFKKCCINKVRNC